MKVLINANIVTMKNQGDIIENGYIKINENGKIENVKDGQYKGDGEVIDMEGDILIPALINGHTHTAMSLLRGYADDKPLKEWLEAYIWPKENEWMNEENVVLGTKLGMLEMLASGTGTFCDMYFFTQSTIETVEKAGMRGLMAEGIIDFPTPNMKTPKDMFNYVEGSLKMYNGGLARPVISVHAPYTTSPEVIERAAGIAKDNDILFVTHTAETLTEIADIRKRFNKTPIEHFSGLIPKDTKTAMAHMVHLSDNDMDVAAERGFNAVHNPQSNLKLSSGIAKIAMMRERGILVSIGTDGAASNNNLDMIEEMRTASLIGKMDNPEHLSAYETMKMATIEGARVLHIDGETGTIEAGKSADIVRISKKGIESYPYFENPYAFIVYAMNSRDVSMTMVNGKILYQKGDYKTLDAQMIKSDVNKAVGVK